MDYFTPKEASAYLKIAASTLAKWRMEQSKGPAYVKVNGKLVIYRKEDLDAFMKLNVTIGAFMKHLTQ